MRIGTWNLAGRWDSRHSDLLSAMNCDVLLLTEVSDRVALLDMEGHLTEALMAPRRRWSGVFSRTGLTPLPDPHGASAAARIGEQTFCSSILPWRSCGTRSPWVGTTTAAKTAAAIASLRMAPPDVWGGDWNHALSGKEYAGSLGGRAEIEAMTAALGLSVATAAQPHRIEGLLSIDHIAIPTAWRLTTVERHVAEAEGVRISDHDAYVVEVDPTAS